VYLDLHTDSPAWSQALGLVPAKQQTSFAAAGATSLNSHVAGITKPLQTWQVDHLLSKNTDDELLGEIWRALGFTTDARGGPAGDDDGKEKAAGVVWDSVWVETALLAGLGWVRPYGEPRHYRHLRITTQDGRQPYVAKWLRQAERFLQRVPPSRRVFVFVRVVYRVPCTVYRVSCVVCRVSCVLLGLTTLIVCAA
jgi:hypothetical protein